MKKLVVNYQNGTVGKEFFANEAEAKGRMGELDGFGTKYSLEDATYEEMMEEYRENAKRSKTRFEKATAGMTEEEKFLAVLGMGV
ncbi:MAG: hypothetical protein NC331_11390 [Lachnospiraceae bacterium]|nr:hypothetical protein [Lachnospiraceae bacterium]MCM1239971.1 hypothetical protein [Lachnospiraceae bacterium]